VIGERVSSFICSFVASRFRATKDSLRREDAPRDRTTRVTLRIRLYAAAREPVPLRIESPVERRCANANETLQTRVDFKCKYLYLIVTLLFYSNIPALR